MIIKKKKTDLFSSALSIPSFYLDSSSLGCLIRVVRNSRFMRFGFRERNDSTAMRPMSLCLAFLQLKTGALLIEKLWGNCCVVYV